MAKKKQVIEYQKVKYMSGIIETDTEEVLKNIKDAIDATSDKITNGTTEKINKPKSSPKKSTGKQSTRSKKDNVITTHDKKATIVE